MEWFCTTRKKSCFPLTESILEQLQYNKVCQGEIRWSFGEIGNGGGHKSNSWLFSMQAFGKIFLRKIAYS